MVCGNEKRNTIHIFTYRATFYYPNWYHDMPMAVYHFLEEYDLAGKTIVPFVTSAGSGLADTVRTIADMQPEAEVVETALALRMGAVASSEAEVRAWVDSLGLEP